MIEILKQEFLKETVIQYWQYTAEILMKSVKKEMEHVLVAMAATNPQYPINSNSEAAEKIVTDAFITNEYLKDFLYAYNYVDRWYDFQYWWY